MEEVRAFAMHVWQRMQKLDHWYLYDLEENAFEQCLAELDSIHRQSYKHLTYQLLAFLLVRKMTCKHFLQQDYTKEKEEFAILQQLFHNEDGFNLLKNEMEIKQVNYI